MAFPVYELSSENLLCQGYDQSTSIEEIEDQMDDWLQDRSKKKVLSVITPITPASSYQYKEEKSIIKENKPFNHRSSYIVHDVLSLHLCPQAADWTEDELSLLSRLMGKFPGGSPGRWEKIAHELGRSVTEVSRLVLV